MQMDFVFFFSLSVQTPISMQEFQYFSILDEAKLKLKGLSDLNL